MACAMTTPPEECCLPPSILSLPCALGARAWGVTDELLHQALELPAEQAPPAHSKDLSPHQRPQSLGETHHAAQARPKQPETFQFLRSDHCRRKIPTVALRRSN